MKVDYLAHTEKAQVHYHMGILLQFNDSEHGSVYQQARVFITALEKYEQRNRKYQDNWKRMGWRGMLVRIRERAERMWDHLWDLKLDGSVEAASYHQDDAIDTLNFVGFLVRAMNDNNRDGDWWNDSHKG